MCNSALGLQMHLRLNYLSSIEKCTKARLQIRMDLLLCIMFYYNYQLKPYGQAFILFSVVNLPWR